MDPELGTKFDTFLKNGLFVLPSSEEFQSLYPHLTPVIQSIADSLASLNHCSLVKYQNKTPKDSVWISTEKNLCCRTPDDVILLLKSSDRVCRSGLKHFQLTFVEWKNDWDSKCEFRLFFLNSQLHGISQRDCSALFPSVLGEREKIRELLFNFGTSFSFSENSEIFFNFTLENFDYFQSGAVVDVYLQSNGEVSVIDVEPLSLCTDFCLFESEERLLSYPIGTLLAVEQEGDCRLAIFNQNFLPDEQFVLDELLER